MEGRGRKQNWAGEEVKIQCGERVPEMVQGVSHSCGYLSGPEDIRRVQIRGVT